MPGVAAKETLPALSGNGEVGWGAVIRSASLAGRVCKQRTFEVARHATLSEGACSEFSLVNSLSGSRTCCSRLVAKSTLVEDFLHWLPIGFDPSTGMAVESVRRHANLSEVQFRSTIHFAQIECGD